MLLLFELQSGESCSLCSRADVCPFVCLIFVIFSECALTLCAISALGCVIVQLDAPENPPVVGRAGFESCLEQ